MADSLTPSQLYDRMQNQLSQEQILISVSELHGILTGVLASAVYAKQKQWYQSVNELISDGEPFSVELRYAIIEMGEQILTELACPDLTFQLLLPDDDEPMTIRLNALAEWAQCFLVGFSVNQAQLKKASEELQEGIQDLAEIARLSDDASDSEENEVAYFEIYEYVRTIAMMSFGEFGDFQRATDTHAKLH